MKFRLSALTLALYIMSSGVTAAPQHHHRNKIDKKISMSATHPGSWEFGVAIGYNRLYTGQQPSTSSTNQLAISDHDNNNFQGGAHLGYYFPVLSHLLIGIEGGYQYLGGAVHTESGSTGTDVYKLQSTQDENLLIGLRYYLTPGFALLGKLGGALTYYTASLTTTGTGTTSQATNFAVSETKHFFDPLWELGILYNISTHTSATLTFNRLAGGRNSSSGSPSKPTILGIMVGLDWQLNNLELNLFNGAHPYGFEVGTTLGYNTIYTGQPTNIGSHNARSGGHFNYHNYGNLQGGGHLGYYFTVKHRLLLGIESGYQALGGAKLAITDNVGATETFNTSNTQAFDALLGLRYYLLQRLALLAKLGVAYEQFTFSHQISGGTGPVSGGIDGFHSSETRRLFNPEWQIGVLIDLSQHLTASLAFNQLIGKPGSATNVSITNPDVMGFLAGVNWDFNNTILNSTLSPHQGGWEIGASLGYNRIDTGQLGASASNHNGTDLLPVQYYDYANLQSGGHVGYYLPLSIRLLLGIETGYQHLGNAHHSVANNNSGTDYFNTLNTQAIDLLAALRVYVVKHIALLAKLGGAYKWFDEAHSVSGNGPDSNLNAPYHNNKVRYVFNPEWQVGLLVDLSAHLNATLAYDQFIGAQRSSTPSTATDPTVGGILGSLNWNFNNQGPLQVTRSHNGGFELGATLGYNRINTGQPDEHRAGNGNEIIILNYHDYDNAQSGAHLAYYLPITHRFLAGFETGYQYLGGAKLTTTNTNGSSAQHSISDIQAIDSLVGLRFYMTNRLALIGKLGAAFTWQFVNYSVGAVNPVAANRTNINKTDEYFYIRPEWQIGLAIDLNKRFNATIAFDQIIGAPNINAATSASTTNPTIMGIIGGLTVHL